MTARNQYPGATSTFGPTCRRVAVALLLAGTLVLCSGCLVDMHRVVSTPGAIGIVLDANTA